MSELFGQLVDWIRQNPEYAGLVVFSMSLAESLAIIGVLIPGVVILFGVIAGTLFTLFVVPTAYDLVGRYTGSPKVVTHQLEKELEQSGSDD